MPSCRRKFVDHSHATAVLSLIDQPNAQSLCEEVYDGRLGFVPYLMPGFGLAKQAAAVFERNPKVEGLILDKHGIFTFGAEARQSYERMIELVTLAERRLATGRKAVFASAALPNNLARAREVAPILRGACTLRDATAKARTARQVLEFRTSEAILNFVNGEELARYGRAGVLTPDHVIRIKPWPLILPAPQAGALGDFRKAAQEAAQEFIAEYRDYFARHRARQPSAQMLDPLPRLVLVPGVGLFGLGASAKDAAIAADVAEAAVEGITDAEAIGRFTSISEADMFDCEYWPLELAKLGTRQGAAARRPSGGRHRRRRRHRRGHRARLRPGRRRSRAARSRRQGRAGQGRRDRRRRARRCHATSPTRNRWRPPSMPWWRRSAASISRCRMRAPPGRAASARSTRRCCVRASN